MKYSVLWNVTHCLVINHYRRFEESRCIRNVSKCQSTRFNAQEGLNNKQRNKMPKYRYVGSDNCLILMKYFFVDVTMYSLTNFTLIMT